MDYFEIARNHFIEHSAETLEKIVKMLRRNNQNLRIRLAYCEEFMIDNCEAVRCVACDTVRTHKDMHKCDNSWVCSSECENVFLQQQDDERQEQQDQYTFRS